MYKTHIYITLSTMTPQKHERMFGYVLEMDGCTATKTGFGKINGTLHHATMAAALEALSRFNQNCQITIHSEDIWFLNMLKELPEWETRGYKTKSGSDMKNRDLWQRIRNKTKHQVIKTSPGKSSYTNWLKEQMEEKKEHAETDRLENSHGPRAV